MSKEKQIEEMACAMCGQDDICGGVGIEKCNIYPDYQRKARRLYNAGYRKQSENVIELPCKIGDTVYIIDEADDECGEDYVLAVKVLQFFINEHGIAVDLALPLGLRQNTWMVVGKNVFLTREEAEAHMRKEDEGK